MAEAFVGDLDEKAWVHKVVRWRAVGDGVAWACVRSYFPWLAVGEVVEQSVECVADLL